MTEAARRPGVIVTVLGMLAVALLLGLGIWQVQRLAWKTALIDRVTAGMAAPPMAAPGPDDWASVGPDAEYRRVSVTGSYLPGPQPLVMAVTTRGRGFWVMTPLRTPEGWTLFINRGFLPEEQRDAVPAAPGGEVTVAGLLRADQPGGGFLRANDPGAGRWFSRDLAALADALGLGPVAPYFIDAAEGDMPVGGLTVVRFANNHLTYAVTWFVLAAGLAGALVWLHLRRD